MVIDYLYALTILGAEHQNIGVYRIYSNIVAGLSRADARIDVSLLLLSFDLWL